MAEQVNPAFEEATRRLAPVVLEILKQYCPWVLIPDRQSQAATAMFDDGKLYTTRELAEKLNVSEKTLHNRFYLAKKSGGDSVFEGLVSRRIGRDRVYQGKDLNRWWESIAEVMGEEQ